MGSAQPVFVCVFARPFAGCYLPAYSHCTTGVNMLTLTHAHTHTLHKASPHQSSPTQCCWPAVCPVQSDCWVQERGMVVWPWPDKAAAHLPFLSVCRSHTPPSICPSIHPSDPQAAQHKHLLLLLPFMPEVPSTGWCLCVSLSLPSSPPSLSWAPSTGHCLALCMCACVLLALGLNGFISLFDLFIFLMSPA